jgi:hypothetical protein
MPHQALRTILPIARWSGDPAASVTFTGGTDPVLLRCGKPVAGGVSR